MFLPSPKVEVIIEKRKHKKVNSESVVRRQHPSSKEEPSRRRQGRPRKIPLRMRAPQEEVMSYASVEP